MWGGEAVPAKSLSNAAEFAAISRGKCGRQNGNADVERSTFTGVKIRGVLSSGRTVECPLNSQHSIFSVLGTHSCFTVVLQQAIAALAGFSRHPAKAVIGSAGISTAAIRPISRGCLRISGSLERFRLAVK
jgi:hypothetical protein